MWAFIVSLNLQLTIRPRFLNYRELSRVRNFWILRFPRDFNDWITISCCEWRFSWITIGCYEWGQRRLEKAKHGCPLVKPYLKAVAQTLDGDKHWNGCILYMDRALGKDPHYQLPLRRGKVLTNCAAWTLGGEELENFLVTHCMAA